MWRGVLAAAASSGGCFASRPRVCPAFTPVHVSNSWMGRGIALLALARGLRLGVDSDGREYRLKPYRESIQFYIAGHRKSRGGEILDYSDFQLWLLPRWCTHILHTPLTLPPALTPRMRENKFTGE